MADPHIRVVPLGGLGEIGKNMMALEFGDDIIIHSHLQSTQEQVETTARLQCHAAVVAGRLFHTHHAPLALVLTDCSAYPMRGYAGGRI